MNAEKIGERVYADTSGEGKGNIGAIELPNFTVAVDSTISRKTALAFRSSLESKVQSPVRNLVITHYHADHTLGIPVFKDCDIITSKPYKRLRKTAKYQPSLTFERTLVLEDEGLSVEMVHVGGHTEDSSYVYFPHEKTLFSGDLIFAKTFFYAGDRTFNPEAWSDALHHFMDMDIQKIVPGHGPLCDKEEIKIYVEFFDTTSSIMEELVRKGANEKRVLGYNKFPAFYPEFRKGIKKLALVNWYRFYKKKERKTRKQ
jgi:glyoxylase-like metal-dependent hydrolase (beta-lactamase superfamily II)